MTLAEYEEAMSCINAQIGMLKQIQYNIYLRWSGQHEMYQKIMEDRSHTQSPDSPPKVPYHEIQIWCSDMWAVLWKGWLNGFKTIPHSNFNFSWCCPWFFIWHEGPIDN